MKLHLVDMPDEPAALARWLDERLVSAELGEWIAELMVAHDAPSAALGRRRKRLPRIGSGRIAIRCSRAVCGRSRPRGFRNCLPSRSYSPDFKNLRWSKAARIGMIYSPNGANSTISWPAEGDRWARQATRDCIAMLRWHRRSIHVQRRLVVARIGRGRSPPCSRPRRSCSWRFRSVRRTARFPLRPRWRRVGAGIAPTRSRPRHRPRRANTSSSWRSGASMVQQASRRRSGRRSTDSRTAPRLLADIAVGPRSPGAGRSRVAQRALPGLGREVRRAGGRDRTWRRPASGARANRRDGSQTDRRP